MSVDPRIQQPRVELIMHDALSMYQKKGADMVELYSQPRITQEAGIRKYGGTDLTAGWSLDLTTRGGTSARRACRTR